jgi:hypothetical protein
MPEFDSQHQTTYLQTLQQLIARMHSASQTSKQVCVGVVAALIAFASATKTPSTAIVAIVPILVLWFLDSFYLSVERDLIAKYSNYVDSLHQSDSDKKTHRIDLDGRWWWRPKQSALASLSFSIWPFYLALLASAVAVAVFGDQIGFKEG